ncbi:hypothetical protein [Amycolatopsis sp. FDAARGOS 1241]
MRTGKQGRPFSDARAMVEGIIYRYRRSVSFCAPAGSPP